MQILSPYLGPKLRVNQTCCCYSMQGYLLYVVSNITIPIVFTKLHIGIETTLEQIGISPKRVIEHTHHFKDVGPLQYLRQ